MFEKLLRAYRFPFRLEERLNMMNKRQEMMFWWLMREGNEPLRETQRRFFSNLPPAEGALRSLQISLLELLQKFDDFCSANKIIYWLDYGCLIGTVRHSGFIPWDDDIDIGISRNNFRRLWEVLKTSPELEIWYTYNNKGARWFSGSHVYDDHMAWCPRLTLKGQDPLLCIDFMIYDEVSCPSWPDLEERWKKRKQLKIECAAKLRKRFKDFYTVRKDDAADIQFLNDMSSEYAAKLGDDNGNYLMIGIEFADYYFGRWIRAFPKEWVYPVIPGKFEGRQFPIPHEAGKYLGAVYGDIYSLPIDAGSSHC